MKNSYQTALRFFFFSAVGFGALQLSEVSHAAVAKNKYLYSDFFLKMIHSKFYSD